MHHTDFFMRVYHYLTPGMNCGYSLHAPFEIRLLLKFLPHRLTK